ncbi:unnamed protein product [Rhizophagus irregularis]|uniref:RING-type domain-containing protein n=1 Tax=Rhizophagus irregularis TaxID=588596 RepID=A0A916EAZ9_9GLOM|nr:unnamed protein product [Rhizophagus irregularis]CAB5194287.1 unnamed protein product [Rhizophagus irregularis]CAB5373274.1 unnamed protein product [Rhizophagus irregularis]
MESNSSNNTPPLVPETIEEEIFGPQYEGILNGSIPYHYSTHCTYQFSKGIRSRGSEICSLCNEPDPLFKPNEADLESVVRLSCLHSFHLKCIIISLKKNTTCPRCQRLIYLGEDDDARLNPQEEDRVKKFFKELSNKSQDFNSSPVTNIETENFTTPDMVFVELHNKILVAERILKEKTLKVSRIEYEILDSYYPLGEALEKKLAEFKSIHPGQTAKILKLSDNFPPR